MTDLTIDDALGDEPNANSNGLPAGHNTDGFDVSTTGELLIIENSTIMNQDDCLAINKGSNITFQGNICSGGHGISIGSITSDVTVSNIYVADNTITNSQQAIRIKTDASATNSFVSNVTYVGNTASGIADFGVIIDQSYPDTLGTPGTGVIISDVNFVDSETSITLDSSAEKVAVNCGSGSCTGTWDWSMLTVNGGTDGEVVNFSGIEDYAQ
ncbi:hypothetical protein PHLCEN_2v12569 [Hermanssonia centrifuga]|uniref:endo-polygalacturonase n=1 Tax=Hermanssonia centrifuga TaxID=98765 RepID=A0A2R6NGP4_9APHY|nr:hypothetical protein PHLCEN_2v12569 [Hermanssonia centrifuga]